MKTFLLFSSLFLFVSIVAKANAEPVRVVLLTSWDDVVRESCRVETGVHFDDCSASRGKGIAVIYFPLEVGRNFSKAINESLRLGYAGEISQKDLFHGHMILQGPATVYAEPMRFFEDLRISLFHSAEYLSRWAAEGRRGLPLEERTPRSFVGWANGVLQKAIDLVTPGARLKSYSGAGTIYTEEVIESNPGLTRHQVSNFGGYEKLFIELGNLRCEAWNSFYILRDPAGRFQTPDGQAYELFFHCRFPLKKPAAVFGSRE
jgi:hypothetical protein